MRKYLYAVPLAAAALVLATPAAQAHTATPHTAVHVLTISKLRGKAVKPGAKLSASLAKGAVATITLGSQKMTCKTASFKLKVVTNPARPGAAKMKATSQKLGKCTINVTGAKVTSLVAQNLPYNVLASDAHGDPVTVSGTSVSAPITFAAVITVGTLVIDCSYSAAASVGHASNTHHTVTFTKQPFAKSAGGAFCPAGPALFSAKFGPIKDISVSGSPTVFVN